MARSLWQLLLAAGLVLGGCATGPTGPGHWQPLQADRVRLTALVLTDAQELADPRVCRYARRDLQRNLVRTLPNRLAPVGFVPPDKPAPETGRTATLRVTITRCRLESHQWDVGGGEPDITFYETLGLRIRLTGDAGAVLLDRRLETVEQIHTDTPSALFEMPHRIPASRIAGLFSRGRVWQAAE